MAEGGQAPLKSHPSEFERPNGSSPIFWKHEEIQPDALIPHPKNYRDHPDDQLDHICASIKEHGFYRNIVVAKDSTILAGHGVVKAALKMGYKKVPVIRLYIAPDSPQAFKILVGDNEMSRLGILDDRLLTEILKDVRGTDPKELLGTGFDDMMLANLVYMTRPASEIKDMDAASHWAGLPSFEEIVDDSIRLKIQFLSEADRQKFCDQFKIKVRMKGEKVWSTSWPWTESKDNSSLKFTKEKK